MNLLKLSDVGLAELRQSITNETSRRSQAATKGHDSAAIIWGNEMAKRAISVAAAGKHSILFVGPTNSGKTMLRAVCLELGVEESFEARPCPCGNRGDRFAVCRCTAAQSKRTVAKFPAADISVQVCRPSNQERNQEGTTLADLRRHAAQASHYTDQSLDENGSNLLKASINELAIDPVTVERILGVARTIANLDGSEPIRPIHLCEAINYRNLGGR